MVPLVHRPSCHAAWLAQALHAWFMRVADKSLWQCCCKARVQCSDTVFRETSGIYVGLTLKRLVQVSSEENRKC